MYVFVQKTNRMVIRIWQNFLSIGETKRHVYGKQQTSNLSWEFLRIKNMQIKTVHNSSLMDKTGVKLLIFE